MKIQELQHPSLKRQADIMLNNLRQQAQMEAEQMMNQYVKDVAENPHTPHPSQIIDQELDMLFHALK
jgi:hypothetical protein